MTLYPGHGSPVTLGEIVPHNGEFAEVLRMTSRITAIATHLPEHVVTNDDLEADNPDWNMEATTERAGVHSRHIAAADETAFDLARGACDKLSRKRIDAVDAIIFSRRAPTTSMPPNAHLLHAYLGLGDEVMAFDINLACSGYIYGLALAHSLIVAGIARSVLLATADTTPVSPQGSLGPRLVRRRRGSEPD